MFLGLFYQENVTYYSALLECVASWSEHSAFPLRGDYDRYRGTPTAELLRGYPETFSHRGSEIMQHPCGNETQGHRRDRAC